MQQRLDRVAELLRERGVDCVAVCPGPSFRYLAGRDFTAHERLFLLFVRAEGPPVAIVPAFEEANFRAAVPGAEQHRWEDKDGPENAARSAARALGRPARLAIEPLGLRYMEYSVLRRHLPDAEIVSADPILLSLRLVKSGEEAAAMRAAARIAERALAETLPLVRVGSTERENAAALSSRLLGFGGEGISFAPIVLGGPNSALPHGAPGDRRLERGDLLLLDFGTSAQGYHCDITRTVAVGARPSDWLCALYQAVAEGNREGCAAVRAGATADAVHRAAQAPLLGPAYAECMRHRTGHGLGLDVHEPPSVMEGNHEVLLPGTAFTVEPGLYREGVGGVRIEDNVWVTAGGCEILTAAPRELIVVGG